LGMARQQTKKGNPDKGKQDGDEDLKEGGTKKRRRPSTAEKEKSTKQAVSRLNKAGGGALRRHGWSNPQMNKTSARNETISKIKKNGGKQPKAKKKLKFAHRVIPS